MQYLVDLLNLKQVGAFLVEDFTTSWKYILIGLAFAAILSVGSFECSIDRKRLLFVVRMDCSNALVG